MTGNELHIQNAKKHKAKAATLTAVLFAAVLFLCFFLTAFTIQDPPPGDQFVAVEFADLGNVTQASGDVESEVPSENIEEVVEEVEASQPVETVETPVVEEVITQDNSEISIPVEEEEEEEEEKPTEEEIRRQQQQERINNLFNNSSSGGGSQGSGDVGAGNEGAEDGKIEGTGVVSGDFVTASLNGGSLLTPPRLSEKPKREGDVRMNIVVDGSGKVISAEYDAKHSTFADSEHIRLARIAAMTATFTSDPTRPRRTGFITIRFELE